MKKFKLFLDIRKEEEWLNDMLKKGWLCKSVSSLGIYHFERTETPDQVIRIDYPTFRSKEAKNRYIQLYEEYGWRHIGSTWLHYWLKPADGRDELFSDRSSRKAYLHRLTNYYGGFGLFFFILTISLFKNTSQFTSLKSAYFTPGLWEKEGTDFLFAFLFETPFALLRFGSPYLLLFFAAAYIWNYMKYQKRTKEEDQTH